VCRLLGQVLRPVAAPLGALALLAGCSDASTVEPERRTRPQITVAAAAPLRPARTECVREFDPGRVRLVFGDPAALARRVRRGGGVDVYAASNMRLPRALARAGRLQRPEAFAADELVLAVPAGAEGIDGVDDLAGPGAVLVIGSQSASAARDALDRLAAGSRIPAVREVDDPIEALRAGGADAGIAFRSDVEATQGQLEAVELPDRLRRPVPYGAAVVRGTDQQAIAQAFLDDLREGNCHDALLTAGFGEPPA
jgi:molybdate transport system substrate-binding protein